MVSQVPSAQVDSKVDQLHSRARYLVAKFEQGGETNCIDEAIILDREALELRPLGHPKRYVSSTWLGAHLSDRYYQLRSMTDLEEAISLGWDTLALCTAGHPYRPMSLTNLSLCLSTRYKQLGLMEDLNDAIVLGRDALALHPPEHRDHSVHLNNLAVCLSTRYEQLGAMEDLNEAIVLGRDALALHPLKHPDRSMSLDIIAGHLYTRYNQIGAMEDLNEAIVLGRDVLRQPLQSRPLNNLAIYFSARYKQFGVMESIKEAIVIGRDALLPHTPGQPDRSRSLDNLAVYLSTRYDQLGAMEDLNESIVLGRDALALLPPGHPGRSGPLSNLAERLFIRYNKLKAMVDLNEAIILCRNALELCSPGHPGRSELLNNLGGYLRTRFTRSGQLKDKEELFGLYAQLAHTSPTVLSADMSAARAWICVAEDFHHPTTLPAYKTCLRLLIQHLASLPSLPRHLVVLKSLTSEVAVDAFSACLRNDHLTDAITLLEEGRGVFWNQLARLRPPLDDVIASGATGKMLANMFTQQTLQIRTALYSPGPDQHDRVSRCNAELERVVTKIRELPGLSRFLLPSVFSDLQQAARDGPVIVVNASKYGCDALVVLVDRDPFHIPLSITKEGVQELSSRLGTLTLRAKSMDVGKDLAIVLRELWDEVVSHIVSFLRTIHPLQSRIWWCPTAEFCVLPLHAAGPFRKGQPGLASLYISSYTPTLTALIRARRHDLPHSTPGVKRFVGIGQANAKGENLLVSVGAELTKIGERVDGLATFTHIEGQESRIARVTEEFRKNEWVHLACHGIPNRTQPFKSAFALHDGHFTIEHIIRCELESPQFAYLSACHTTVGDEESPDEVVHLASAMQFAGFRSVIGTMWAVDDGETNEITSMFYNNMKDERGRLDYTRAALALNRTMKKLAHIPFDQRILYIHIGA